MINNPFSLSGKIILVTGASSGIGQAIAIECANRGAKIVLNGRNLERLKSTFSELSGSGHLILEGDLTIPEIIKNIVSEIPCIDGMVLC
ncbi:MAG: SDR family NAD(P)-dependent oxidoreductase, partial [Muribaculaceae bacterium]|nr:SDR family NAD(P)-dependent oxidoreductase [Muribaculaceae bacterium]